MARKRTSVMLLTLSGQWSVEEGYERLGMKRTRFQDLRRRMLKAAVFALEGGVSGRPRRVVEPESEELRGLRSELDQVAHELARTRAQLDVAESSAGEAVKRRREQQRERRP